MLNWALTLIAVVMCLLGGETAVKADKIIHSNQSLSDKTTDSLMVSRIIGSVFCSVGFLAICIIWH